MDGTWGTGDSKVDGRRTQRAPCISSSPLPFVDAKFENPHLSRFQIDPSMFCPCEYGISPLVSTPLFTSPAFPSSDQTLLVEGFHTWTLRPQKHRPGLGDFNILLNVKREPAGAGPMSYPFYRSKTTRGGAARGKESLMASWMARRTGSM